MGKGGGGGGGRAESAPRNSIRKAPLLDGGIGAGQNDGRLRALFFFQPGSAPLLCHFVGFPSAFCAVSVSGKGTHVTTMYPRVPIRDAHGAHLP